MEIDDNEKMRSSPPPTVQRELPKEEPINSIDPVDSVDAPTDIAVGRKRSRWAQQTLQDVEGHEAPHGTFEKEKDLRGSPIMLH